MALPEDPYMLLSYVNMKLRDGDYESLKDMCESLGCDEEVVVSKLKSAGFEYVDSINQFR